ncbi:MAG: hypothetical protein ACYTHN_16145 [Planctomycetota bacterium]
MLRDGLFSADAFVEAAKGFILLRLKPGPAESLFGITAAPMAAVADWYGRVVVPNLNLRGDMGNACNRLRDVLRQFDRKKASRPPYVVPDWAEPFMKEGGEKALAAFLEAVHPRKGGRPKRRPSFPDLVKVYRSLEKEGDRIQFCKNAITAFEGRTPSSGRTYKGYAEEVSLLEEMTYCRNDRVKFLAIPGMAKFVPLAKVGFFVKRVEEKAKDCRNPNIILCNCMAAIGEMTKRFPGLTNRRSALDYQEILKVLPVMVTVLDTEGRNNGACARTRASLEAIMESTGAPEALEAYIHNFKAPNCDNDWMRGMTEKYHQKTLPWIRERTGQSFGPDFDTWSRWFAANKNRLFFDARQKRFILNAGAAKAHRAKLAKALKKK